MIVLLEQYAFTWISFQIPQYSYYSIHVLLSRTMLKLTDYSQDVCVPSTSVGQLISDIVPYLLELDSNQSQASSLLLMASQQVGRPTCLFPATNPGYTSFETRKSLICSEILQFPKNTSNHLDLSSQILLTNISEDLSAPSHHLL